MYVLMMAVASPRIFCEPDKKVEEVKDTVMTDFCLNILTRRGSYGSPCYNRDQEWGAFSPISVIGADIKEGCWDG